MSLRLQFITMIAMFGCGIYIGMAVDTFNRFHMRKKRSSFILYLNEILFWVLQGLIFFYFLYLINQGEIRFYVWIAVILGFMFYQAFLKVFYATFLELMIRCAVATFRFVQKLVNTLIIIPVKRILQLITYLLTLFWAVVFWLVLLPWRIFKKPILNIGKWTWKRIPKNAKKYLLSLFRNYSKIKGKLIEWWKMVFTKRR